MNKNDYIIRLETPADQKKVENMVKGKGSAVITAVVDGQRKSLNVRVYETVELTSDMFKLEYTLTEYTGKVKQKLPLNLLTVKRK